MIWGGLHLSLNICGYNPTPTYLYSHSMFTNARTWVQAQRGPAVYPSLWTFMPYIHCGISTLCTKLFMTETLKDHPPPPSAWIPTRKIARGFLFLPITGRKGNLKTTRLGEGRVAAKCWRPGVWVHTCINIFHPWSCSNLHDIIYLGCCYGYHHT